MSRLPNAPSVPIGMALTQTGSLSPFSPQAEAALPSPRRSRISVVVQFEKSGRLTRPLKRAVRVPYSYA